MRKRKLITFDWAMKKLLRSKVNFDILEGFLSELLHEQIIILEVLESESNKEHSRDKYNRIDLKVRNDKDEIIIIEIQYDREYDYLQRILYGASKVISEHINEHDSYGSVVKVISVNIIFFDLGVGKDYIYKGQTHFRGLNIHDELQLSEKQEKLYKTKTLSKIFPQYYLIKVNNFNDIAKTPLDEWIYFLKNEEIKDNFKAKGLKKAKDELDILKLSDEDRAIYSRYQDDMHLQASMVESHYIDGRMEGRKEGREEGIKEGIKEGKKEGIKEGMEKGQKEQSILIAKNLLQTNLTIEQISQTTGLSVDEINEIK